MKRCMVIVLLAGVLFVLFIATSAIALGHGISHTTCMTIDGQQAALGQLYDPINNTICDGYGKPPLYPPLPAGLSYPKGP